MKRCPKCGAGTSVIFFMLAMAFGAEEVVQEVYEGVLPGAIVVHIATAPMREIVQNAEAFIMAAAEGTPAAMQFQPGFLNMMLAIYMPLPPGMLDMDQPLQFFVCCPKPRGEQPLAAAALLPVGNFKEKIEHAKGLNFTIEDDNGALRMKNPVNNTELVLVDAGKGYAAVSDSPAAAREVAEAFKAWDQKPIAGAAPTAVITMDIGKFIICNRREIDEAVAEIKDEIEQAARNDANAPPPKQAAYKILPRYLQATADFLGDIRSARIYLNIDNANLRISTYLTPKNDTKLYRFAKAYASADVNYEQAKYLPQRSAMVACCQMLENGQAELLPFFKSFFC